MNKEQDYNTLYPADWQGTIEQLKQYGHNPIFADTVLEYLNALSASILKDPAARAYSDLISFAFFIRKANLLRLKESYQTDLQNRYGRGIVFHIAPSNVAINFAYSLVVGMLSGNANIVRLSSKPFEQVDLLIKHLHKLAQNADLESISRSFVLVRYEHESSATALFSQHCAVRVIWGGDNTILNIRRHAIPARSMEITFADRYSLAVVHTDALLNINDTELTRLAEHFYNDTFLFDQNACTSPHLIVWYGKENADKARQRFWDAVHKYTSEHYTFNDILAVDKLTAIYKSAVNLNIRAIKSVDNLIQRVELSSLEFTLPDFRCAGGYFNEYLTDNIEDILPIIHEQYQTLSYFGFDKSFWTSFIQQHQLSGIDRIVPIGQTSEFAILWDGYDLIREMSRWITTI